jgi:uncharacterized membrane protein YcaP (DUF421 family)
MGNIFKHRWQAIAASKISWLFKQLTNRNVKSITTSFLVVYPNKKWSYVQTINYK